MAVFPDRIVLKNSTDNDTVIRAAIGAGGSDQIQQGELVLGIKPNNLNLFTVDGDGTVVNFSGGGGDAVTGRGDGGDFDLGIVESSFTFGIYGGGDFDSGTVDNPEELLVDSFGPDGGIFE